MNPLPFPYPAAPGTRVLRFNSQGLDVVALQRALNYRLRVLGQTQLSVMEDGYYHEDTATRVRGFQRALGLEVDGVAGQQTQLAAVLYCAEPAERTNKLPAGLIKGLVVNESLGYLGAINTASPGGYDLGAFQRRVLTASLKNWDEVSPAYDPVQQASVVAADFRWTFDRITSAPTNVEFGVEGGTKGRWQLTVLSHNYPAAVSHLSAGERSWRFVEEDIVRYPDDKDVGGGRVSRLTSRPARWIQLATNGRLQYTSDWCRSYITKGTAFVEW